MLRELVEYLTLIPAAMLLFFPVKNQLRYSRLRTFFIVGTLLVFLIPLSAFVSWRFPDTRGYLLWPVFLLLFAVYHGCLTVHLSKSLAVMCLVSTNFMILSNISNGLAVLFALENGGADPGMRLALIRLGVCCLATLLLAYPYGKYGSVLIDQTTRPKTWNTLVLFSGVQLSINLLLLPVERTIYYNRAMLLYMLSALGTMLALWMLVQGVFFFAVSDLLNSARAMERTRFLEVQESQFAAQQRYIKATERVRHDFRHSITTLRELYDSGEYEALGRYLDRFKDAQPKKEVVTYTDNIAVNALLNYYAHLAARNRLDYRVQVKLPEALSVTDMDLCTMIGNIMDNAVLAAQKTEERLVQLSILTEDAQLYIVVTNSFDGIVRQKGGEYLSTNRQGRAIGLSSVSSTAESYGGEAQFSHEGNRFYSNVAIPLS